MGSVQFQIVPCFRLYFFSRSIGPFQFLVNANYCLICCTCHFQSGSLFFVYFGFLCLQVCSVSNFRPETRVERGHLCRLTSSVVLWGRKNTANKYHWHVWHEARVLTCLATLGFPPVTACVLSQSTLLRFQAALQGNCPKQALGFVYFPGPCCSGSRSSVLHKGTDLAGHVL